MCRVLADIVVAILGAGKLNHLWPAHKSVQIDHKEKQHQIENPGPGSMAACTYKTMSCTML